VKPDCSFKLVWAKWEAFHLSPMRSTVIGLFRGNIFPRRLPRCITQIWYWIALISNRITQISGCTSKPKYNPSHSFCICDGLPGGNRNRIVAGNLKRNLLQSN
jgi:hypothetical protein